MVCVCVCTYAFVLYIRSMYVVAVAAANSARYMYYYYYYTVCSKLQKYASSSRQVFQLCLTFVTPIDNEHIIININYILPIFELSFSCSVKLKTP